MNALELYRELPKKNCGKCSARTCMPFALSVISGQAELSDCPLLTEEELAALKASVIRSDWREELILKLREEIKNIDFADIAEGLGAEMRGGSLVLKCMGREFAVSPDGEINTQGRMTPWMRILLLHYIRTACREKLTGRWTAYRELKGGMVKASSFERECEEPLRDFFDRDPEKTATVLSRLGAVLTGGFPTENAWRLLLLPRVPIVILYWPAEEEFASKVKVLFDSTASSFLDAESLIFLVEGLVRNIEMAS